MNGQDWELGANGDDENQSDEINSLLEYNSNSDDELVHVSRKRYATALWIGTITVLFGITAAITELRYVRYLPFLASENKSHGRFSSTVSIKKLCIDLAALSIEMMQSDTSPAATESVRVDIGPFCDLIDKALDDIGIRGVYIELFDTPQFLVALKNVAGAKGLHDFYTYVCASKPGHGIHPGQQPTVHYLGVPNDREASDSYLCHGCLWWLYHYVGSVTADKLLREESLLLTSSHTGEHVYNASSVIRELHHIQRMGKGLVSFHAEHGFIWQYITATMPLLDAYPLQVARDFCGDLLTTDEDDILGTNVARECWHSFGHSVFHVLAMRELLGKQKYDSRMTLRPHGGFVLSEESVCEGYRICMEAPNDRHAFRECYGGFRHSIKLYQTTGEGEKNISISKQFDHCISE